MTNYGKKILGTVLLVLAISVSRAQQVGFPGINNPPLVLSEQQKKSLHASIQSRESKYDPDHQMIIVGSGYWEKVLQKGEKIYHATNPSFQYALDLLDSREKKYEQRAFDVISKTIKVQAKDPKEPFCGVWPYYEEEPLEKDAVHLDYNWANFNSALLLDTYIDHYDRLPQSLRDEMKASIILATQSIVRRNVRMTYTNIAVASLYCVAVAGKLFNIKEFNDYYHNRLREFYAFTKSKGGFSEYNSPAYTVHSMDLLEEMLFRLTDPEDLVMIKDLYHMHWDMIARHYHPSTTQWAGPYSRVYSTLVRDTYYKLLQDASDGKINLGMSNIPSIRVHHRIPDDLLHYFTSPKYPRTEMDVFEPAEPSVLGTAYMTKSYALSSSNRSSLWGQRRPLMAFWGAPKSKSNYFQLRFLHDDFDFSAASLFSSQQENKIVSGLNFAANGGDRHILLDTIANNRFQASDLRLLFEFGNCKDLQVAFPKNPNQAFEVVADGMHMAIQIPFFVFGEHLGYWERGVTRKEKDMTIESISFVFYKGDNRSFDWKELGKAGATLAMSFDPLKTPTLNGVKSGTNRGNMEISWEKLKISVPMAPQTLYRRPALEVSFPANL